MESFFRLCRMYFRLIPVLLMIFAAFCGNKNDLEPGRIENPSFEDTKNNKPAGWSESRFRGKPAFAWVHAGRSGSGCVMISSEEGSDAAWSTVAAVKPFSEYRLSVWIKTEDVSVSNGGFGALFNLHDVRNARSEALTGTNDWTQIKMDFNTDHIDAVQINCLFGGWGLATGKVWYDDVSLELLSTRELNPAVTVQADREKDPISKYIYGQFIEHLGRCIYGGIWAEMIEDRKFYYRPGDEHSPWHAAGDSLDMTMITEHSFVGDQTPGIMLIGDGSTNGLVQEELGLKKGMGYSGRIILRGDQSAGPVKVSLIWGVGANERETVLIDKLSDEYTTVPLHFTAGNATGAGKIEIISNGKGRFSVGTVSLMPDDNVEGFRADVLKLLKELDAPVYRWPGGNFVSGYNWKDGIGDRDRRPPRKNPAWRGVEHNDVGIHEFIRLCRLIDTEPYVTVNTGLGTVEMAAEEIEYCNGSAATPMGRFRAENGHPEPFAVKWWAVGNEMYGSWQLGNMPVSDYIKKQNKVVDMMRAIDPSINVVGVGSVGKWDEAVLAGSADHMNYISEHFYCQESPGIMAHVAQASGHIKRIAASMRKYHETIPELAGKKIPIAMDEWNYWYGPYLYGELGTRYFLKDALGIAAGFHEYYRNSDIIYMANYAQTVNVIGCIKTTKTESAFAVTGLVLKLYRHHFGKIPLEIAGTPEPLDVSAAFTDDRTYLTVGIVNPTRKAYTFPFAANGVSIKKTGTRYLITGNEMDYNEPGKEPAVTINESTVAISGGTISVPPVSISLFVIPVER